MAVERPTFHESWYRVADLHPRLRSTVQVSRQHFRGLPWFVVQDHTNNAFFRLAEPAYRFIGLLDGVRTVGECWKIVNEQKGDDAPTQGEVIQLLGQLYMAKLLQAEVPADTYTLFARYKKRKQREVASYLMNIMFARLPLFDPDAFLNRWLKVLGWIFSPVGLVVWLFLIGWGVYAIVQRPGWASELGQSAGGLLSPDNLILLYVGFALIKACHEMGHAISCKKFGRQSGTGGEVHVIGIMFLVFTPVPYVDASSSWALQNKWHRAIVGAAGMWVELAIASLAAVVWANTGLGSWQHHFAYNVMFVASFSTVVFNGNPLLRYDGYYILSDLLEIPNLGQRSKDYVYHLVKRYVWNVRFSRSPAQGVGEQIWLFLYAISSFLMRTFVSLSIMFYLTTVLEGALIIVAFAMAVAGLFTWLALPVGKFAHYLVTSQELTRVRGRAIATTLAAAAALVVGLGVVRAPDRSRAQGVVMPLEWSYLLPGGDANGVGGFVAGLRVDPTTLPAVRAGDLLATTDNRELRAKQKAETAAVEQLQIERQAATPDKRAEVDDRLSASLTELYITNRQVERLELKSPGAGTLVAPALETRRYGYLRAGEQLGMVADLDHLTVVAVVPTDIGGQLEQEKKGQKFRVEMRIDGEPEFLLSGQGILLKAGMNDLPSAALAMPAGGDFATAADDRSGTRTQEKFFMVRIDSLHLDKGPAVWRQHPGQLPLYALQRVVVRFEFTPKPLVVQGWKKLLQVFQRRFQV